MCVCVWSFSLKETGKCNHLCFVAQVPGNTNHSPTTDQRTVLVSVPAIQGAAKNARNGNDRL